MTGGQTQTSGAMVIPNSVSVVEQKSEHVSQINLLKKNCLVIRKKACLSGFNLDILEQRKHFSLLPLVE